MYEVGMNIVTEGEKTTPIYEVWNNMCDSGLCAKSLHQYMRYGLIIVADGKKKKKPS